jgi:hypothetical protein
MFHKHEFAQHLLLSQSTGSPLAEKSVHSIIRTKFNESWDINSKTVSFSDSSHGWLHAPTKTKSCAIIKLRSEPSCASTSSKSTERTETQHGKHRATIE